MKPGDTIGIIAPASPFPPAYIEKTESNMASLGLQVKWSKNISRRYGYLAGRDKHRVKDLHRMFADSRVQGIWCIRGGYGSGRLLQMIDYALIRENPKILVGFSDITALLNAIHQRTGLVCFHGPVASSPFTAYTRAHARKMLFGAEDRQVIMPAATEDAEGHPASYCIRAGKASGVIAGGNLSLLAALCGTPFQPDVRGKILFIEEIGEKPYRVDRMLTQLRQSMPLKEAAGIMLGIFADCEPDEGDKSLSLEETLQDRLGDLDIPVGYGFSFGHIEDQCTLPVGGRGRIDTRRMIVEIREPVVQS